MGFKKKIKDLFFLFLTFFKIGLFTFGGGYAMIAVIEKELVEKRALLERDEYLDIISIAESTPGPIAINSATFIGYKKSGFLGSLFSTFGVVLPSFIIIFCISLFFEQFLQLEYVKYAFKGIEACVAFLILSAGIKMFKSVKKDVLSIILFSLSTAILFIFSILSISFSSIYFVLIGGFVGIIYFVIMALIKNKKGDK